MSYHLVADHPDTAAKYPVLGMRPPCRHGIDTLILIVITTIMGAAVRRCITRVLHRRMDK